MEWNRWNKITYNGSRWIIMECNAIEQSRVEWNRIESNEMEQNEMKWSRLIAIELFFQNRIKLNGIKVRAKQLHGVGQKR